MYGLLIVFADDGHRSRLGIDDEESATSEGDKCKVIAVIDHRTDGPVAWTQHGILTGRPARRSTGRQVYRGGVVQRECVGGIVCIDALQEPSVLIGNDDERLVVGWSSSVSLHPHIDASQGCLRRRIHKEHVSRRDECYD